MGKPLLGACLMLLMLCRPEDAANGARQALCQWYYVVAPSLFPFMALMPLMTCPEANRFYDAALGGLMRGAFGLPGSAAAPMIAGMIAGSPAGCCAARAVAVEQGYSRGQLERVASACCGMSPAFFISAVGAGMLEDAGMGHILLRAQVCTQLAMLALTRWFCRDGRPVEAPRSGAGNNPVLSIINVAGYMALFGAISAALRMPWVQLLLEVSAGSDFICGSKLDVARKLAALAALSGFGGMCVVSQNIGALKACGVNPFRFVSARCLAGLLSAGFTWLQIGVDLPKIASIPAWSVNVSCILAVILAVPAVYRLKRTIF